MAAGSIIVDLLMRTGSFETDTARAEKRLKAFQKQVESVGKAIGTAIGAGVVLAAAAFETLVASAGDLKDLEEQTGALAEDLGSLAIAASVAGTSVADIASQANKLTKNLSGVDDESKAAGAALAALGIPIEEFKKLDPVGQIDALSKAFNSFADGSQKTAVAMALFGKNGAAMLNVFKELDAEGGRNAILTQQQIELADEFIDRQKRQAATIKAYAQAGATDLLPVLNDLTTAAKELAAEFFGIDAAGKKLAGESPVKAFGEGAVDVLAFVVDAAQGVVRTFQAVGTGIAGAVAAVEAARTLQFGAAKQIAQSTARDIDAILSPELFSQRLARIRQASAAAGLGDPNQSSAETARLGRKPSLSFNGAEKGGKTAAQSEAERYLETLQKQAEKTLELSTYEQALLDIEQKRIKGLTPDLEKQILAQAQFNDLNKQALDFRTAEVEVNTARAKLQLAELDAITKSNVELQKEIDLMGLDAQGLLAVELQRVRVTKAEKEATLAKQEALGVDEKQLQVLQEEIAALQQRESLLLQKSDKQADLDAAKSNTADLAKDAGTAMSESIAEGILDGTRKGLDFTDVFTRELKAQFAKTTLAPIIKPVVDAQNEGVSQILKYLGGLAGLGGTNTTDYRGTTLPDSIRGGAATGTNLLERDMITLVHKGEAIVPKEYNPAAGGKGGGGNVYITNSAGAQVSAQRDQNGDWQVAVAAASDAAYGRVLRDVATGTGPVAVANRQRSGTGPVPVATSRSTRP